MEHYINKSIRILHEMIDFFCGVTLILKNVLDEDRIRLGPMSLNKVNGYYGWKENSQPGFFLSPPLRCYLIQAKDYVGHTHL